jgi:hypothetical protein
MQLCAHICQKEICKKCVPEFYGSNAHDIFRKLHIWSTTERKKEREKRDTLDPDDRSFPRLETGLSNASLICMVF